MSLQTRLADLTTAIGTDVKQFRVWLTGSSSGDLTGLETVDKTNVVAAINEVLAAISDAGGGDVTTAMMTAALEDLKEEILGADVPLALDTLLELAAALGDDENFSATMLAALATKQDAIEIGDPDVDLVAVYTAAKA